MNILEVCSILQLLKKETVSFADIGSIIGISRQYVSKMKNDEIDDDKLKQIEEHYKVKLPKNYALIEKKYNNSDVFAIPYWDGYCECAEKLKRDDFPNLKLPIELINSWNAKPENLCIIAMPGDDMDGGDFPIKNKDLLIIDTSRNDTYESGIFFATSHGCTRVYVRRIFEKNSKEKSYYTSIDNPIYKSVIDKIWTEQQWKEADIKIIGRVITNATYTI